MATLVGTMETMHPAGRRTLPPVPGAGGPRTAAPRDVDVEDEVATQRFEPAPPEQQRRRQRRPRVRPADDVGPATQRFEVDLSDEPETQQPGDDADPATERFVVDLPEDPEPDPAAESRPAVGAVPRVDEDAPATAQDAPPVGDDPPPVDEDGPPVEEDAPPVDEEAAPAVDEDGPPVAEAPPVDEEAAPAVEDDPAQDFVTRLRSAAGDFAEAAGAASAVVREAVPPARHRRARCRVVLRYADDTVTEVTFLGPAGAPGTPSRHGFDRQIRRWFGSGQLRSEAWVIPDPEAPEGVAVDVTAWVAAG